MVLQLKVIENLLEHRSRLATLVKADHKQLKDSGDRLHWKSLPGIDIISQNYAPCQWVEEHWHLRLIYAFGCGWTAHDYDKLRKATLPLTLSRPGGTLCLPHLNPSISSQRLGVWNYCFVTFLSMYFPFRKVQLHQSALMYVATATMQLFAFILKTRIAIVF